ncbi:MAG: peptidylprolyl isomerase [Ktedonobacterales bacterium]
MPSSRFAGFRRRPFLLLLGTLLAVVVLAGCASAGPASALEVASVNGQGITLSDFQVARRFFAVEQQQQVTTSVWQSASGRTGFATIQDSTLGYLEDTALVHQQATACHVQVSSASVAKYRSQLVAYVKSLASSGQNLLTAFTPRMYDLFAQYDAEEAALYGTISVPSVQVSDIVVGSQSQAQQIQQQAANGADFAQLAKRYSQDSQTASKGGDRGIFFLGQLASQTTPTFEQQLLGAYRPISKGGCYSHNSYPTTAPQYKVIAGTQNQYDVYKLVASDRLLKGITSSADQQTVFVAWLSGIVRPHASITIYLAPATGELPRAQPTATP